MTHEPFESDPIAIVPPRKCKSALAQAILKANPSLATKSDPELVTAHHRCLWNKFRQGIDDWRSAGGRDRERLAIERLDAARNKTTRECVSDLVAVGLACERAQEIAAAVVAAEDEYRAVMATLNEALFA